MESLIAFAGLSLALNAYFFYRFKFSKKALPLTMDAQALLAEIASGSATLNIQILDPTDFLIRRKF